MITNESKTLTVKQLADLYLHEQINDTPVYQRPERATDRWRKGIIKSIFTGFPLPPFYLRKVTNPAFTFEIVDGGHRTRTIVWFYTNKIKTPTGFKVNFENKYVNIGNMTYNEIKEKYSQLVFNLFDMVNITVNYLSGTDNEIASAFRTVNNGNELSAHEKRQSSHAAVAEEVRHLSHMKLNDEREWVPGWHPVFDKVDFKLGKWEYGDTTAQCASYELNKSHPNIGVTSLDKMYLNDKYNKEFPIIKRVKSIFNEMEKCLNYKTTKFPKKYFINFYLFLSELKDKKIKINNYKEFMLQYCKDETKRRNTIIQNINIYSKFSIEKTPIGVNTRIEMVMGDFDKHISEYNVIKQGGRNFKEEDIMMKYQEVDCKCEHCEFEFSDVNDNMLHADHDIPYARGGKSEYNNLVILCKICNQKKGNRTMDEFIKASTEKYFSMEEAV